MTEVLYPFSGLDKIPAHIVENAGRRGTVVHGICEGIVRGLGEWDVTEEARPYIDSFKQWWKEDIVVVDVEKRF